MRIAHTVKKCRFNDTIYRHGYSLDFFVLLDTFGKVTNCVVDWEFSEDQMETASICKKICKTIKCSGFRTDNLVSRSDTSYFIKVFRYHVTIHTESKSVRFNEQVKLPVLPVVYYLEDEKKFISFEGFTSK